MARSVTSWSLGIVLLCAGAVSAQDGPPLEAPATEPDAPKPAPKPVKPAIPPPAASSPARPMLVVPGVTTPPPRPSSSSKPLTAAPARGAAPRLPAPPPQARDARPSPFRPPGGLNTPPVPEASIRAPIPLTIEPIEDVPSPTDRPSRPSNGRITPQPRPGSARGRTRDDASTSSRPAPSRVQGLLGRILGPSPPAPSRDRARNAEARTRPDEESPGEPATDTDVKRKIERQIRDVLGERVRAVEVRVNGKNVLIVAQASRFWQKRAVRRSLETLPALSGYRARVELDE